MRHKVKLQYTSHGQITQAVYTRPPSLKENSMKSFLSAGLTSLLMLTALNANAATAPERGSYKIDPMHSKVGFEVTHLAISTVEGKFNSFDGTIEIAEKFEQSKVTAVVEINSIDTGVAKRDTHLKSADFFDAAKFPKMTFKSTAITGSPESFKLTGDLTIRGKTKPVTFEAKYTGSAVDSSNNLKVAFSAKTKISRKEFGVTGSGTVVGDEVTIDFKIEAAKPVAKTDKK